MKKETIKRLVLTLWDDLSTLSADNPSFYANIYARKYNDILKELKALYKDESFIQNQPDLKEVKDLPDRQAGDSMELTRLMRNVISSVNQLKAFLEAE